METKARYLVVGGFTIAVILALFGFVFWLDRTGGLAGRMPYRLRFANSVSGLQTGAAVLFDGVRVGEVTGLTLDPADPEHVVVDVAVLTDTPIHTDTRVGIEYQGLMGSAAVAMEGGTAHAPRPSGQAGGPATLVTDPAASRSLTQSARDTLQRVDTMLSENAESLKATIDNLKAFSGALARNSDKVDGLMAGLETLAGGGPPKKQSPVYDLAVPKLASTVRIAGQIAIGEPTAAVAFQTQRLLARSPDGQLSPVGDMQWSDTLPKLLQARLLQTLENLGVSVVAAGAMEHPDNERQLQLDLRAFNLSGTAEPSAVITFSAKLLASDGRVLRSRTFEAEMPCSSGGTLDAVKAFDAALRAVAGDLVAWLSEGT